jgi:hypothetical protein
MLVLPADMELDTVDHILGLPPSCQVHAEAEDEADRDALEQALRQHMAAAARMPPPGMSAAAASLLQQYYTVIAALLCFMHSPMYLSLISRRGSVCA